MDLASEIKKKKMAAKITTIVRRALHRSLIKSTMKVIRMLKSM